MIWKTPCGAAERPCGQSGGRSRSALGISRPSGTSGAASGRAPAVRSRAAARAAPGSRPALPPSALTHALQLGGGQLHGLEDLGVAGAPAEVARERERDLLAARARVLLQQRPGAHQDPGGAE